jgi:hypothetical protein
MARTLAGCWVAALALVLTPATGAESGRQRVAVVANSKNPGSFVLTPLSAGPAKRDSGTTSYCCVHSHSTTRDGQPVEIANFLKSYEGKLGTLTLRIVLEWTDAGNGYTIGSGTWKIAKGTKAYAHLQGNGRLAVVADTGSLSDVTWRAVGYVHR